jgi:hypothetical protein
MGRWYVSLDTIISLLTALGAIGGISVGLYTFNRNYKQGHETRKKEVVADLLFPLLERFNKSEEFHFARDLLDDFTIPISDDDVIAKEKYREYISSEDLPSVLRHYTIELIISKTEQEIRRSFDEFISFLSRIEFLVINKLMSGEDARMLFGYYLDRAAKNNAIVNYVRIYKMSLRGFLVPALNGDLDPIK